MTDDNSSSKRCTNCEQLKPLRAFPKCAALKSGYKSVCKTCANDLARRSAAHKRTLYASTPIDTNIVKRCTQCGEDKPLTEYSLQAAGRYGRRAACKDCLGDSARDYRDRNREQVEAYQRAYYQANRKRILAVCRKYRNANKERYLALTRNRRARLYNARGEHTFEEVWQMLEDQGGLCAYCETELFNGFEVDHMIPVSKGGANDWTNLAIACKTCNISKNAKTVERFMEQRRQQWSTNYSQHSTT